MKQELLSFLESIKNEIYSLCKNLYDFAENSYEEYKSCEFICDLLNKYGFKVEKNYLDIETSFYASKGSGYPKICYLCEYDAISNEGHITGHNLLTSISVACGLTMGEKIDELGGTIILIGCPGEYLGGTKSVMVKQGVFDDIDVVMTIHPDIITAESGSSNAIIPLCVKFIGDSGLSFLNKGVYTSLDGVLLTFNILNAMMKGFPNDVEINSILSKGGLTPLLLPLESEAKFYIRSPEMDLASLAENKLREIVIYVSKLIRVQYSISPYEPYNEELITNKTLSRLFCHNLKETGIINISPPHNINSGLSLGVVSKKVPTIHPYISIVDNSSIKYGTNEFSKCTITEYGFNEGMKAAQSLILTSLDIIENESLLQDIKKDFFNTI